LIILIVKEFYTYLEHLKFYVRNKAQPEGSIAEGYLAENVLTFFYQYMEGMETRTNRSSRVDDSSNIDISKLNTLFPPIGRVVSVASAVEMSTERTQEHQYVLFNCVILTLNIYLIILTSCPLWNY